MQTRTRGPLRTFSLALACRAAMGGVGMAAVMLGVGASLAIAPHAAAADAVSLKPMFKVGDTATFDQQIRRMEKMVLPANMGDQTVTVNIASTWTSKVTKAGAEGVTIELTLKDVKADMEQVTKQGTTALPAVKAEWDSAHPDKDKNVKNPVLMAFRPTVGAVFEITLGADDALTSVKSKSPLQIGRSELSTAVDQLVGEEWMKARWGEILAVKPGKDQQAKVGDEWTRENKLASPPVGELAIKDTNTLAGVQGDVATIKTTGVIQLVPMKGDKGVQAQVKDTAVSATTLWDTKLGCAKSNDYNQKWTLDVNAQGLQVERPVELHITTTRK